MEGAHNKWVLSSSLFLKLPLIPTEAGHIKFFKLRVVISTVLIEQDFVTTEAMGTVYLLLRSRNQMPALSILIKFCDPLVLKLAQCWSEIVLLVGGIEKLRKKAE